MPSGYGICPACLLCIRCVRIFDRFRVVPGTVSDSGNCGRFGLTGNMKQGWLPDDIGHTFQS